MDHLGLALVLYLLIAIALWTALAFFIAPFIGRWIRGDFSEDRPDGELVGFDEPSEFERYRNERALAAARGEVHAARARRRRLDAMERERNRGAA